MQIKGLTLEKPREMKKETKRLLSSVVGVAAGALGTAFLMRKRTKGREPANGDRWARPGMLVTFRAEIMPARDRAARTFRVSKVLPSNRVLLEGVAGEHAEQEFERGR